MSKMLLFKLILAANWWDTVQFLQRCIFSRYWDYVDTFVILSDFTRYQKTFHCFNFNLQNAFYICFCLHWKIFFNLKFSQNCRCFNTVFILKFLKDKKKTKTKIGDWVFISYPAFCSQDDYGPQLCTVWSEEDIQLLLYQGLMTCSYFKTRLPNIF